MNKISIIVLLVCAVLTLCAFSCKSSKPTTGGFGNELPVDGGYGTPGEVKSDARTLWDKVSAVNDTISNLTPITVQMQVVAGFNYRYTCKDKDGKSYRVLIFKPLDDNEEPSVTYVRGLN